MINYFTEENNLQGLLTLYENKNLEEVRHFILKQNTNHTILQLYNPFRCMYIASFIVSVKCSHYNNLKAVSKTIIGLL